MKKYTIIVTSAALLALGIIGTIPSLISTNELKTSVIDADSNKTETSKAAVRGIGSTAMGSNGQFIPKFSFSGDPGSKIDGKIRLLNMNKDTDLIANTYPVGTKVDAQGSISSRIKKDPGPEAKWIAMAETIPLKKGEEKIVPFTINIPGNARPGDHSMVIQTETIFPTQKDAVIPKMTNGGKVIITSAVGNMINLRVSGKEIISALIGKLRMTEKNPYTFRIEVENSGNITLKPKITTTIDSVLRTVAPESIPASESFQILPEGKTEMVIKWKYQKIGIYTLRFEIDYNGKREMREMKVIIYPSVTEIAISILILIIIICGITYYIRRKKLNANNMATTQYTTPPGPQI